MSESSSINGCGHSAGSVSVNQTLIRISGLGSPASRWKGKSYSEKPVCPERPHLRPNAIFTASSTADFPALFSPIKTEIGESEISRSRMHLKFLMIRRQMCIAVDPEGSRCRSEEHTSELQSLMRTSYAAFCLKQ